ncbi:hypothetical protein BDR26DRAFT_978851 [Obelidium mucronatum]|nr:hypothetical protein BDR26DRAFT_978851 [Obelidium mucronatum]
MGSKIRSGKGFCRMILSLDKKLRKVKAVSSKKKKKRLTTDSEDSSEDSPSSTSDSSSSSDTDTDSEDKRKRQKDRKGKSVAKNPVPDVSASTSTEDLCQQFEAMRLNQASMMELLKSLQPGVGGHSVVEVNQAVGQQSGASQFNLDKKNGWPVDVGERFGKLFITFRGEKVPPAIRKSGCRKLITSEKGGGSGAASGSNLVDGIIDYDDYNLSETEFGDKETYSSLRMANTLMDKLWVKPRQVCPTLKDEPWVKETPSVQVFLNEVHVAADVAGIVYVPLVDPSLDDLPIYLELKEDGDIYLASKLFSQIKWLPKYWKHERRAEDAADGDELQRCTCSSTREFVEEPPKPASRPVAEPAKPTLKKVFGGSSGTSQPAPPTPVAQAPPKKFVKFDPQSQAPKRPCKLVRKGPSGVLDPEAVAADRNAAPISQLNMAMTEDVESHITQRFMDVPVDPEHLPTSVANLFQRNYDDASRLDNFAGFMRSKDRVLNQSYQTVPVGREFVSTHFSVRRRTDVNIERLWDHRTQFALFPAPHLRNVKYQNAIMLDLVPKDDGSESNFMQHAVATSSSKAGDIKRNVCLFMVTADSGRKRFGITLGAVWEVAEGVSAPQTTWILPPLPPGVTASFPALAGMPLICAFRLKSEWDSEGNYWGNATSLDDGKRSVKILMTSIQNPRVLIECTAVARLQLAVKYQMHISTTAMSAGLEHEQGPALNLRVACWNPNSVRNAVKHMKRESLLELLSYDVVLLQESKIDSEALKKFCAREQDFQSFHVLHLQFPHEEVGTGKGRNGVMTLLRKSPTGAVHDGWEDVAAAGRAEEGRGHGLDRNGIWTRDETPEQETKAETGLRGHVKTGNWNQPRHTQCCKPNGSNARHRNAEPETGTGSGPSRGFFIGESGWHHVHPGPPTVFWGGPSDGSNTLVYADGHRLKHTCVAVQPDRRLRADKTNDAKQKRKRSNRSNKRTYIDIKNIHSPDIPGKADWNRLKHTYMTVRPGTHIRVNKENHTITNNKSNNSRE